MVRMIIYYTVLKCQLVNRLITDDSFVICFDTCVPVRTKQSIRTNGIETPDTAKQNSNLSHTHKSTVSLKYVFSKAKH